jgi:hypothetical protein
LNGEDLGAVGDKVDEVFGRPQPDEKEEKVSTPLHESTIGFAFVLVKGFDIVEDGSSRRLA